MESLEKEFPLQKIKLLLLSIQCNVFEKIFIQNKSRHIQNQLQIYTQGNNEARKYMRSFPSVYTWGKGIKQSKQKMQEQAGV